MLGVVDEIVDIVLGEEGIGGGGGGIGTGAGIGDIKIVAIMEPLLLLDIS